MRERPAEGEDEPARVVDLAAEMGGTRSASVSGPSPACLEDGETTRLLVGDELVRARAEPTNGKLRPGRTKTTSGRSARRSINHQPYLCSKKSSNKKQPFVQAVRTVCRRRTSLPDHHPFHILRVENFGGGLI